MSKFQDHKEAPDEVWLQIGYGDEGTHTWASHKVAEDDIEQAGPYVRADRLSGRVRVKPLHLNALLRDAFLAGRGLRQYGKCSEADLAAWADYEPPSGLYERILAALEPAPTPPAREKALREAADIAGKYHDEAKREILSLIRTTGGSHD